MTTVLPRTADWGTHQRWVWRGQQCHWRHVGDPSHPSLVLIHGFATGSGHWRGNAQVLASAGWSVYGLDLVGFGASTQPALRLDNRLWASQVQAFLKEVVQGPAVLVGHSLGGLVALTCSVFSPELVLALIAAPLPDPALLMASATDPETTHCRRPPWRRKTKRGMVRLLCHILPLEVFVPLLVHSPLLDLAIQAAYCRPVVGDGELRRLIAGPARQLGAVRALRAMSKAMALRPFRATAPSLLRRVRRPMLLIWGEQDALVPLEVGWQCQRFRRDIAVMVIPDAGHCPHDEKPQLFNGEVIAWLANLSIHSQAWRVRSDRPHEHLP
jgi:pimeloyl-ACP methyl ester carboxylesterase